MSERQDFMWLARQEDANIAALCRQFGISRKTAYKWLGRAAAGDEAVQDRSRRPQTSPHRTSAEMEARIVELRQRHPAWGGRKLHHRLRALGVPAPPPSTITSILRRHGLLPATPPRRDFVRFVRETVNDLWQMDFMGHRALRHGRVHPLTVVDDHSRFALLVSACANQQQATVKAQLTAVFRRFGLPQIILCDNGSPWATAGMGGLTSLEAWLVQLGIEPWHGRPHHPQTQGKVERFHGTIAAEVFGPHPAPFADLPTVQTAFDTFRTRYNHQRPHEALTNAVPASHYQPSSRPFPDHLPAPTYGPDDVVRTVTVHGSISWQGRRAFVSRGLVGQPVAIRPTDQDGVWDVVFCQRPVARIDRHDPNEV